MEIIHQLVHWYFQQIDTIGLELFVFLGMLVESSLFPFPSEIIMPPAAWTVGQMSQTPIVMRLLRLVGLVLIGTAGSLMGALFNYYLGYLLGRPFFEKYGKYLLISKQKLAKMDDFWDRYGEGSTFIARLVPAVRQLISIPAGISRMNIWKFSLFTSLGAGFWVAILAAVGWLLRDWSLARFETELKGKLLPWVLALVAILILAYGIKLKYFRSASPRDLPVRKAGADPSAGNNPTGKPS